MDFDLLDEDKDFPKQDIIVIEESDSETNIEEFILQPWGHSAGKHFLSKPNFCQLFINNDFFQYF